MANFVLDMLRQKFGDEVLATSSAHGDDTALIEAARIVDVCRFLRDDPQLQFTMLIDIAVVDRLRLPGDLNRFNAGPRGIDHMAARHSQLKATGASIVRPTDRVRPV